MANRKTCKREGGKIFVVILLFRLHVEGAIAALDFKSYRLMELETGSERIGGVRIRVSKYGIQMSFNSLTFYVELPVYLLITNLGA